MDGSHSPASPARWPWWLPAVAAVVVGQAGMALHLFGSVEALTDDRPVVSGRHPLHLYHASLGAAAFRDRSATSCYDPSFQAGYPKTPVFDGGCRPAEVFLTLAGGDYDPAAYKLGLFAVCALVPVCFAVAGRAAGLTGGGAALAAAAGGLVWWSPPVRALLDAGHLDLLLAGLTGLVFVGGLVRYDAAPLPPSWLLLAGPAVAGWYAHPVAWLALLPVVAAYYVAVAPRHGPAWHLGLVGVTAAGLGPNLWWLSDWGRFWWLRQPSVDDLAPLPTWAALAGCPDDYVAMLAPGPLGWVVAAAGAAGLVAMARTRHGVAAGVLLVAAGLAVVLARLGETWPTLQTVHAGRATLFATAVQVIPAAFLLARWWESVRHGRWLVGAAVALPVVLGWLAGPAGFLAAGLGLNLSPLSLGLTGDQERLVAALRDHTTPEARILIEEPDPTRPGWNWTALLPVLTDRTYLGGLDGAACVEHSFCGLRADRLNGRPFAEWTADERAAFATRYNVGWVLTRTPAAGAWWAGEPTAKVAGRYRDGDELTLFALDRPRSFVLTGSAVVDRADRQKLVLSDVAPNEAGEVVLSFHHQPGMRVAPSVVRAEPDKDLFDPIPMTKLRLQGPVSRVTVSWEAP